MWQHRRPVRRGVRHDDRILVAHDLAEPASHAIRRHDFRHLVMARPGIGRVIFHVNAVKRANIDAKLTARAIIENHLRLRDLTRLDAGDEISVLVLNAGYRAVDRADTAINAAFRVDDILLLRLAADRVHRTLQLANRAPNTRIRNEISHRDDRSFSKLSRL